jgi:hypothetical protein
MIRQLLPLMLTAAAVAATPALAADPEVALVNEASQVTGCERLAEVRGRSNWGGVFASKSYDWALGQMKERAVALGATHVLLLNATNGYTGSNMLGVAYRCAPAAPASAEP